MDRDAEWEKRIIDICLQEVFDALHRARQKGIDSGSPATIDTAMDVVRKLQEKSAGAERAK
jgi:hypothetical protein